MLDEPPLTVRTRDAGQPVFNRVCLVLIALATSPAGGLLRGCAFSAIAPGNTIPSPWPASVTVSTSFRPYATVSLTLITSQKEGKNQHWLPP